MALSSLFKRKTSGDAGGPSASASPVDGVQKVRTRTRRRLIGAVVLVTVGVIGFPLLFESQPRPIPVDIPIEIPSQDNAPALALPAARRDAPVARSVQSASGAEAASVASVTPRDAVPTGASAPVVAASAPTAVASAQPAAKPTPAASAAASERVAAPTVKPAIVSPPIAESHTASAAVKAASEPASGATAPRFVVQVGAFADPASAREVRLKMEKMGLKTYAQAVETKDGKRIRVRLGPFASRAEADKAAARTHDAGVASVVLTL
jgi:DedD protein